MDQIKADAVMAHLRSGGSFRSAPASHQTIKRHGKLHPDWWEAALALALANGKNRGVEASAKIKRAKTHCTHGHPLSGENLGIKRWKHYTTRFCKTCHVQRSRAGYAVTAETKAQAIKHIEAGLPLTPLFTAGPQRLFTHGTLLRLRREDHAFNRLVLQKAEEHGRLAPILQAVRRRNEVRRRDGSEYHDIRSMVPRYLPPHVQDEITQNIFVALLTGALKRSDVKGHIRAFVTDQYRMFPTRFARLGRSTLLSLDAAISANGTATRGEFVTAGLWSDASTWGGDA